MYMISLYHLLSLRMTEERWEVRSWKLEVLYAFDKPNARSPSDTFLSESETRSTFD